MAKHYQLGLPGLCADEEAPYRVSNPREVRAIRALAACPRSREELDGIAGASNSPDLVSAMRRKGLEIPSVRGPVEDQDGVLVYRGQYSLTAEDRLKTRHIWEGVNNDE